MLPSLPAVDLPKTTQDLRVPMLTPEGLLLSTLAPLKRRQLV
jgi:hypothetical protein